MKTLHIKDICDKGSSNLKQKDVEGKDGLYPVYGASGIISNIDFFHQEKEYIAIVKDGSGIGRVKYMPAKSSVIGTMQYILPKEGYNIKYISYCLQSLDLAHYKQGAAIPHIYFRDYGEEVVTVADSLAEQEEIVRYLDAAFAKIDALKKIAEQQLTESKALFQKALSEYLSPKKGWEEKKLGEVCDQLNGLWKGKKEPFINVGVIRNANFTKDFTLNTSNIEYLDVEERSYSKRKLYPGDLIVEKSGGSEKQPVGRAILFDIAEGEYSFSNFTSVLRIKDRSFITPEYLYKFLLHSYKRGDTRAMQNAATGIHNIIWESYLGIEIPLPPLPEQQAIVAKLDTISAHCRQLEENYRQTLALCDDLKQKILKQVFE